MVSGEWLGFNLAFNIPLVKPDGGVPINIPAFQDCIPHGHPLFVSQLLSSALAVHHRVAYQVSGFPIHRFIYFLVFSFHLLYL